MPTFRTGLVVILAAVTGLSLLSVGCGGGGGPATPTTLQFIFGGEDDRDGFVGSSGLVSTSLGVPLLGDIDSGSNGIGYRQFFSFYIGLLPPGATVVSATLHLYQQDADAGAFTKLGNIVVDHMFYDLLGQVDFAAAPLSANIGVLSTDASVGYRVLDVTAGVRADITAGRPRSQYRVRFALLDSNSDNIADNASFTDTENTWNGMGGLPYLVVNYLP